MLNAIKFLVGSTQHVFPVILYKTTPRSNVTRMREKQRQIEYKGVKSEEKRRIQDNG